MRRLIISTDTITYAIKGRDLLRRLGYKAHIERRTNASGGVGCGYVIIAEGNPQKIVSALKNADINILDISSK